MPNETDLMTISSVRKRYGDNVVLDGIDLRIRPGETLAIAGENGAGKSTLMHILAGLTAPDGGEVSVSGTAHDFTVVGARRLGIGIVPQELAPIPDLPVYANIFLGREPRTRFGMIDRTAMIEEAGKLLGSFGVPIDPKAPIGRLSTASQQLVELLKCISSGADILLLDEPTSALAQQEVDALFAIVRKLCAQGIAVLFTTHKMAEMRALATRMVILRDGRLVADKPSNEISDDEIVTAMVGRKITSLYPVIRKPDAAKAAITVSNLVCREKGAPLSFDVKAGEVVALAGLVGAGRTMVLETLFGVHKSVAGTVEVGGQALKKGSTVAAIDCGMALVPEDRRVGGAVLSMSILYNGVLPHLGQFTRLGYLPRRHARQAVTSVMQGMLLKYQDLSQEVGSLSGGNQQKVVVGRWLTHPVRVLLLDEPTRGVDINARHEIYNILAKLAVEQQIGILIASSDMAEVIGLAHRILVMRQGRIVAEMDRSAHQNTDRLQQEIFRYASGLS